VIAVNLTGAYLCAQAQAQQMIRQSPTEGKIINTASMSARIANCNASYDASKAGIVHMTHTLAAEWGRFNINVNCISPSYLLTPMHASTPTVVRERIRELTPLGHVQRPEDLYGAVVFLASAASNYVTGHDLLVDGGHTLNAWLTPLGREIPPRVSPEEEVVQMKHDLDAMGIPYDADGINPDLHPEIADAFKGAFGLTD
ncbi:MAG: SDR family oxidoreductase, partial [bacterium]|nr:SDR family oxidoreductase [bacterium]